MITEIVTKQMHPADIQAALKKSGLSQKTIATALQISTTAVNGVIHGKYTSRHIAEYIAEKLGKTLEDIWPGRYTDKPSA